MEVIGHLMKLVMRLSYLSIQLNLLDSNYQYHHHYNNNDNSHNNSDENEIIGNEMNNSNNIIYLNSNKSFIGKKEVSVRDIPQLSWTVLSCLDPYLIDHNRDIIRDALSCLGDMSTDSSLLPTLFVNGAVWYLLHYCLLYVGIQKTKSFPYPPNMPHTPNASNTNQNNLQTPTNNNKNNLQTPIFLKRPVPPIQTPTKPSSPLPPPGSPLMPKSSKKDQEQQIVDDLAVRALKVLLNFLQIYDKFFENLLPPGLFMQLQSVQKGELQISRFLTLFCEEETTDSCLIWTNDMREELKKMVEIGMKRVWDEQTEKNQRKSWQVMGQIFSTQKNQQMFKEESLNENLNRFVEESYSNPLYKRLEGELRVGGIFVKVFNQQDDFMASLKEYKKHESDLLAKLLFHIQKVNIISVGIYDKKFTEDCDEVSECMKAIIRLFEAQKKDINKVVACITSSDSDSVATILNHISFSDQEIQKLSLHISWWFTLSGDLCKTMSSLKVDEIIFSIISKKKQSETIQTPALNLLCSLLVNLSKNSPKAMSDFTKTVYLLELFYIFCTSTQLEPRIRVAQIFATILRAARNNREFLQKILPPKIVHAIQRNPSKSIELFDQDHYSPDLVWTRRMRESVTKLVSEELEKMYNRRQNDNFSSSYSINYEEIEGEECIAGVYLKPFLKDTSLSYTPPTEFIKKVFEKCYQKENSPNQKTIYLKVIDSCLLRDRSGIFNIDITPNALDELFSFQNLYPEAQQATLNVLLWIARVPQYRPKMYLSSKISNVSKVFLTSKDNSVRILSGKFLLIFLEKEEKPERIEILTQNNSVFLRELLALHDSDAQSRRQVEQILARLNVKTGIFKEQTDLRITNFLQTLSQIPLEAVDEEINRETIKEPQNPTSKDEEVAQQIPHNWQ
eukprot:c19473_g1_i1.p1 GENE.c19473_g1_i1~~c19473_g1_i1.p1  ORF type:complete len:971 (+),score=331.69 c19473_g1_i1:208-2913(+)